MVGNIKMIDALRTTSPRNRKPRGKRSSGAALLVCIFVISMTSLIVVHILDNQTARTAAVRNTLDYERALYLAGAGIHHALAELEADGSWRDTVSEGSYPADGSYSASAVDDGENILITSTGVSGTISRSLSVTVEIGS